MAVEASVALKLYMTTIPEILVAGSSCILTSGALAVQCQILVGKASTVDS